MDTIIHQWNKRKSRLSSNANVVYSEKPKRPITNPAKMLRGHISSGPGGASTDEKKSVTFDNKAFVDDEDDYRGKDPTPDPQNQDSDIHSQLAWDVFTETPADNFAHNNPVLEKICMINLKTLVSIFLGLVVLGTALLSRLTFLEIVQQLRVIDIRINSSSSSCPLPSIRKIADVPHGPPVIQIRWIWALFLAVCFPYCTTIFKNIRRMLFKSSSSISCYVLLTDILIETIHSFGLLVLSFIVLTSIDPVRGSMLIYGIGFIPCLLNIFPIRERGSTQIFPDDEDVVRKSCFARYSGVFSKIFLILIFLSLSVLFVLFYKSLNTDYSVWPFLSKFGTIYYMTPISLIMISFKYWNIFSDRILLREQHKAVHKKKEKIAVLTSILKIGYTLIFIIVLFGTNSECHKVLFDTRTNATKCGIFDVTLSSSDNTYTPFKYAAINMLSGYICYSFARTACQLLVQRFSFSLPLVLTGPISTILVLLFSTQKFSFFMMAPRGLTPLNYEDHFVCLKKYYQDDTWRILVIGFYLSFLYITRHVWIPKVERLAKERKLFASTEYCGILTDQSLLLSRRRDKEKKDHDITNKSEPIKRVSSNAVKMKKMKDVPLIYACATMWHETENEMMQLLKSLFRMGYDQSTRRYTRDVLGIHKDYYEFEAHIFFDDAFDRIKGEEDTYRVNDYVKTFMKFLPEACKAVHDDLELGFPRKIMTPYGGRLEWEMPGGTPLVAHLKNKRLIRHKKRWSQVMYMYYFLGQRIAAENTVSTTVKSTRFQNTFLLALDGDVDFEPSSVLLLVDRMTRNPDVGAACGRIHPIGTGPMVWYQKFEYAISHWLQKATEHMIGCVLCSPGCFSLFRGSALSSDNVLRRYTTISSEAKHKVQYDQGEDRWLCTLLLQQGYRVEYCAASDALTYCPETFNEFFKQRRRWAPSTMANIMDLLMDWRNVRKKNDSISVLYIFYQACLMGASIITPGTILMLIVGALHTAYDFTLTQSFILNLVPIFFMMLLCFTCSEDIQLQFASVMSLLYAMYMMVVIVGLAKEIGEFRQCSTTTLLFGFVCGTFIVAAILHPKEIFCLLHGILYFLLIPAMSLLLMFYALGNLQNVSWGTRDSKAEQDAKADEAKAIAQAKAKASAKQQGGVMNRLQNIFALRNARDSGSEAEYTFSFGRICRCLCLLKEEKFNTEDALLEVLTEQEMSKPSTSASEGGTQENSPQNENESNNVSSIEDSTHAKEWTDDEIFDHMVSESISESEESFWRNLIKQYLPPEHTDKAVNEEKLKQNLVELRNHVCMFFCLINALFVIIVFTIELSRSNSESISFRLPWCENTNTKMKQTNIITVVFILVFGLTLLLQLVAMVFHRYETFLHILASIDINPRMMNQMDTENFLAAFKGNDHDFSDAGSESTTDTLGTPRPRNHISLFKRKKKRVQSFQEKMDKRFSSVYKRVVENPNDFGKKPLPNRLSWMYLLSDAEIRRKAEIRMRWIRTTALLRKQKRSKFESIVHQAQIQKHLENSLNNSSVLPDDLQSDDIDDNCIVTGSSVSHGSMYADVHDQARGEPVQKDPDIAGPNTAAPKKSQLSFGRIVEQVQRQNNQRLSMNRSSGGVDDNWIMTESTGSTRADVYDIVDPDTAEADQNGSQWDFIKRKKKEILSASSGSTPPAPPTDAGIDKSSVPSDHQSLLESESGTELTAVSDLENAESVEDYDASTAL